MKKLLIVFFIAFFQLFSFHSVLFAQNQNRTIDSLLSVLKTAKEDTGKVNILNSLSRQFRPTSNEKAMQYADSALVLADKINFKKGKASAYNNIGEANYDKGSYPDAMKNYNASIKISEEIGDKTDMATSFNSIGRIYVALTHYLNAMSNCLIALKLSQECGDKKGIATSYHNIGLTYHSQDNLPAALTNYLASLKIREEIGDKSGMASSYNNIGMLYRNLGNYQEAMKNYNASIKISEEIGEKRTMGAALDNVGDIYTRQGNYTEALNNYVAAFDICQEIGYKAALPTLLRNIGTTYSALGNYPEAMKKLLASLDLVREMGSKNMLAITYNSVGRLSIRLDKFSDARKYLNDALSLAKEIRNNDEIKNSYNGLSELDSAEGNFAQALEHYKLSTRYKDSVFSEASKKQAAQLGMQYETEKKDREIAENKMQMAQKEIELTKKSNANRMLIGGVAGLVLLVVLGSVGFIQRQKLQNNKKDLEKHKALEQTRAAIARDLHDDVGSTLSSIRIMSTVAENNPEQSAEMMKKIGVNSQRMLENMSDIVWTVSPDNDSFSEMLVRMNQYAAQMMEPKGIRFKITTDEGSENMQLAIEHRHDFYLIFKEAINNLAKYSECSESSIVITGHLKFLSMKITDDGKGFGLNNETSGNGLKNMRKRTENIKGDLKISSVAGKGTVIELQVPVT